MRLIRRVRGLGIIQQVGLGIGQHRRICIFRQGIDRARGRNIQLNHKGDLREILAAEKVIGQALAVRGLIGQEIAGLVGHARLLKDLQEAQRIIGIGPHGHFLFSGDQHGLHRGRRH